MNEAHGRYIRVLIRMAGTAMYRFDTLEQFEAALEAIRKQWINPQGTAEFVTAGGGTVMLRPFEVLSLDWGDMTGNLDPLVEIGILDQARDREYARRVADAANEPVGFTT